jgi:hypothetical protein
MGGYSYLSEIPLYPADIDLELPGQWRRGDLIYVEGAGYRYYDGVQWRRFGVGLEQLDLATRNTDLVVAGGQTQTAVTTTVTIDDQTVMQIRAQIPMLEFTATSGGEAQLTALLNDTTPYVLGHMTSDRQFGWPVQVDRFVPVTAGAIKVDLQIVSINAAVTAHAGTGYGDTGMQLLA